MPGMSRRYYRTEAGRKAWDMQSSHVPLEYRRVLGLVGHDTDPKELRAKLGWSESAVNDILDELEEQGLVRWIDMSADRTDLDFTGSFSVSELQGAQEDLDFTSPLSLDELRAAQKKRV
jgi:hypothetical protein